MALLILEGLDAYSSNAEASRKHYLSAYVNAWGTSYGRFGSRGAQITTSILYLRFSVGERTSIYFGAAIYPQSSWSYSTSFPWIGVHDPDGNYQIQFFVKTDGSIEVRNSSGSLGTTSNTGLVNAATWFYFEAYAFINNTTGAVKIRVNGNEELSLTNVDTQSRTTDKIQRVQMEEIYNTDTYYDDIYFDDSQFHGDIKVVTKLPSANGTYSDFTPLSGSNYENVDETTPDDDTTYNKGSAVGDKDSFTIPSGDLDGDIVGVQVSNYTKKTGTKKTGIKNLVRVGGSDYNGDEEYLGTSYDYRTTLWENNPNTTNPWSAGEVLGAEYGIEVTSLSTTTTT